MIKVKDLYPSGVDISKKEAHTMLTEVIARADEFRVEKDVDNWVYLVDGEDVVRATMPYDVWLGLAEATNLIEKLTEICLEDQGVKNLLTS